MFQRCLSLVLFLTNVNNAPLNNVIAPTSGSDLFFKNGIYNESDRVITYGKGFGTEWMYFPDGKGMPHVINLTAPEPALRIDNLFEIQYRLYNKINNNYILLSENAQPVDPSKRIETLLTPVKIITHGWRSSIDKESFIEIIDAYLKNLDVTVVAVDWRNTADSLDYPTVARQTKSVGFHVGKFLNALHTTYNISGANMHLIGHSLGAHVMGNAAAATPFIVQRITGLDPARPFFETPKLRESEKLDNSDANLVDIIHTCSSVFGVEMAIGDADFYPNNGTSPQPGCESSLELFGSESCSHNKALHYFLESIKNKRSYRAYKCRNWEEFVLNRCIKRVYIMGEGMDPKGKGKFYLKTITK